VRFVIGKRLAADLCKDFANEPPVSVHGTSDHRVPGRTSHDTPWLAEFDQGKERSPVVKILGHGIETRGDDAADVVSLRREDVKCDGCSEIDDDSRHAEAGCAASGIGKSVGSDGAGRRVIDSHTEVEIRADPADRRVEGAIDLPVFPRHNGGGDNAMGVVCREEGVEAASREGLGWEALDAADFPAPDDSDLCKGIANVDQDEVRHGDTISCSASGVKRCRSIAVLDERRLAPEDPANAGRREKTRRRFFRSGGFF
jgi:hypothetical protein